MLLWTDRLDDISISDWEALSWSAPRPNPFLAPEFLLPWRSSFIPDRAIRAGQWRESGRLRALILLFRTATGWEFLGGQDVADRLDALTEPGVEELFWKAVFEELPHSGETLVLPNLSPWSAAPSVAQGLGLDILREETDSAPFVELDTEEAYLAGLSRKQRHELLRKTRRAERLAPTLSFTPQAELEDFLHLHRASRPDKEAFMAGPNEAFFRAYAEGLQSRGRLRLAGLTEEGRTIATMFQFRYGSVMYLYNSGFDPARSELAPGVVLLWHCLRAALAEGIREYDFLRGRERYKYDLGGRDRAVYRLTVRR